jgi:hypothetical protein
MDASPSSEAEEPDSMDDDMRLGPPPAAAEPAAEESAAEPAAEESAAEPATAPVPEPFKRTAQIVKNATALQSMMAPFNYPVQNFIEIGERCGDTGDFTGYAMKTLPGLKEEVYSMLGFEIQLDLKPPQNSLSKSGSGVLKAFCEPVAYLRELHRVWRKNKFVPPGYVVVGEEIKEGNYAHRQLFLVPKKDLMKFFWKPDVQRMFILNPTNLNNPSELCRLYMNQRKTEENPETMRLTLRSPAAFGIMKEGTRTWNETLQKYVSLRVEGLLTTRDHTPLDRQAVIKKQRAEGGGAASRAAATLEKRAKNRKPKTFPETGADKALARAKARNFTTSMVTENQLRVAGGSKPTAIFVKDMLAQLIKRPDFRGWTTDPQLFIDFLVSALESVRMNDCGKQESKQFQTVVLEKLIPIRIEELRKEIDGDRPTGAPFSDLHELCAITINAHKNSINKKDAGKAGGYPWENTLWQVLDDSGLGKSRLTALACGQPGIMWQQELILFKDTLIPALERIREYVARPVWTPPIPGDLTQRILANLHPPEVKEASLQGEGTDEVSFFRITYRVMTYLMTTLKYEPASVMQVLYHLLHLLTALPVEYAAFVNLDLVLAFLNAENNEDYIERMREAYAQEGGRRRPRFPELEAWGSPTALWREMIPPDERLACVARDTVIKQAKKADRAAKKKEREEQGAPRAAPRVIPLAFHESVRRRAAPVTLNPNFQATHKSMIRTWAKGTRRIVVIRPEPRAETFDIGDGTVMANPEAEPDPEPKRRKIAVKGRGVPVAGAASKKKKPADPPSSAEESKDDTPKPAAAPRAAGKRPSKAGKKYDA